MVNKGIGLSRRSECNDSRSVAFMCSVVKPYCTSFTLYNGTRFNVFFQLFPRIWSDTSSNWLVYVQLNQLLMILIRSRFLIWELANREVSATQAYHPSPPYVWSILTVLSFHRKSNHIHCCVLFKLQVVYILEAILLPQKISVWC